MKFTKTPEAQAAHKSYREQRAALFLRRSQVSPRFYSRRLEDLEGSPVYNIAAHFVSKWQESAHNGAGLFFWGNIGAGKTYAASCVANEILRRYDAAVFFASMTEVFESARKKIRENIAGKTVFDYMRECDLLVIDDIGMERPSDWVREQTFAIINYRYDHKKPTIYTSNQPLEGIAQHHLPQVASRIREVSTIVQFSGPDRRITSRLIYQ